MKIAFLAHRLPYPPNKGDKIRTFNLVKYFATHYEVDVYAPITDKQDNEWSTQLNQELPQLKNIYLFPHNYFKKFFQLILAFLSGKALSPALFYNKSLHKKLRENQTNYQLVFAFSGQMCLYLEGMHHQSIIDFCDVDSYKWEQYSAKKGFFTRWIYKLEARRLKKYEIEHGKRAKQTLFVTESEKTLFLKLGGHGNCAALRNGVDHKKFHPCLEPPEKGKILFTGAMDYFPNIEAVLWFAEKVFPLILKEYPFCQFIIAGSKPSPEIQRLSKIKNIVVTGFVNDMLDEFKKADIIVAPLQIARGLQNKVLEGMSCQKPVVLTPEAATGIEAKDEVHWLIAQSNHEFAKRIMFLLDNPQFSKKIAQNARKFVEENYDWDKSISNVLNNLGEFPK